MDMIMEPSVLQKLNITEKSILFKYNLEPHDIDEDGVQYIIVDNKKNFLEIDSEKIVCTYNFTFPITKVERISVFYSYEPKFKFYVILFGKFIIVLKKTSELIFVERINEVSHYYISDYYDSGKPQVVICFVGNREPIVTDFANNLKNEKVDEPRVKFETENRVLYGLNMTILSQMQSLNIRKKDAEKQLEEKTQTISKLTSGLVHNVTEITNLPCNAQMNHSPSEPQRCEPLSVGSPWVRSYCGKWVIGFPISNLQEKPISQMQVFIYGTALYVDKTMLFVHTVKTLEGSEFKMDHLLQGHKIGILVAVVREPIFNDDVINLSCYSSFCFGTNIEKHQTYLGEISVTLQDIMANKLTPFHSSKSFRDILTYISVSIKTQLFLRDPKNKYILLSNLKDNYGFTQVTDRHTVNIMANSLFTGVLVGLETNYHGCTVDFYTKDSRQLTLFLQCLHKYQFQSPSLLTTQRQSQVESLQHCIKQELNAVQNVLSGGSGMAARPKLQTPHVSHFNNDHSVHSLRYLNNFETQTLQNLLN